MNSITAMWEVETIDNHTDLLYQVSSDRGRDARFTVAYIKHMFPNCRDDLIYRVQIACPQPSAYIMRRSRKCVRVANFMFGSSCCKSVQDNIRSSVEI